VSLKSLLNLKPLLSLLGFGRAANVATEASPLSSLIGLARASPDVVQARQVLKIIKNQKLSALKPVPWSTRGATDLFELPVPNEAWADLPPPIAEVVEEAHKQAYSYGFPEPTLPTADIMATAQQELIDPIIRPLLGLTAREMAFLGEHKPLSALDAALGPIKERLPVMPDLHVAREADRAAGMALWDAVASRRPDIARRINKFYFQHYTGGSGAYMPRLRKPLHAGPLAELVGGNALWHRRGDVIVDPRQSVNTLATLLHEGKHAMQASSTTPGLAPRYFSKDKYRDELGPIFEELQASVLEHRTKEALARNALREAIRQAASQQAVAGVL